MVYEDFDLDEMEARLASMQAMLDADIEQEKRLRQIERQITNKTDCTEDERMRMMGALAVGSSGVSRKEINQLANKIAELKLL